MLLALLGIAVPAGLLLGLLLLFVRADRSAEGIRRPFRWAQAITLAFLLLDWGLIASLAPLGLSFGPVVPYGLLMTSVRGSFLLAFPLIAGLVLFVTRRRPAQADDPPRFRGLLISLWVLHLLVLTLMVEATLIEPFALQVSRLDLDAPGLERPLRVVHISDIHVEYTTRRERDLISLVNSQEPDMIVLTGDYMNLAHLNDPRTLQETRDLLAQLHAPLGVYAVNGTVDSPARMEALFSGLEVTVLDDQTVVPVRGLALVGVAHADWGKYWERDRDALQRLMEKVPPEAYSVLLYHTPDLIEAAAEAGVDLYLAGHTHGGQVRLPFYGAIFTASRYGKKYESGRYTVGPTTLYVSRGIGMEGFQITPRVRFLCPPEMVVLDLHPPD